MNKQRQAKQLEPTYNSSAPTWDVALVTRQKQRTIEKGGGTGSGIYVRLVRHDDDDDCFAHRRPLFKSVVGVVLCLSACTLPSPNWKEAGWENANFSSKMRMSTKINKTIKAINKSLSSTKLYFKYFIMCSEGSQ